MSGVRFSGRSRCRERDPPSRGFWGFRGFRGYWGSRVPGFPGSRVFWGSGFPGFRWFSGVRGSVPVRFPAFRPLGFPAFQLSSFPAFRLSGFPAFRLSGFPAFPLSRSLPLSPALPLYRSPALPLSAFPLSRFPEFMFSGSPGLRAWAPRVSRLRSSGFRVPSSEFRVPSSEFRVPGSGFRVPGSGFGVRSSEFGVSPCGSVLRLWLGKLRHDAGGSTRVCVRVPKRDYARPCGREPGFQRVDRAPRRNATSALPAQPAPRRHCTDCAATGTGLRCAPDPATASARQAARLRPWRSRPPGRLGPWRPVGSDCTAHATPAGGGSGAPPCRRATNPGATGRQRGLIDQSGKRATIHSASLANSFSRCARR